MSGRQSNVECYQHKSQEKRKITPRNEPFTIHELNKLSFNVSCGGEKKGIEFFPKEFIENYYKKTAGIFIAHTVHLNNH